MKRSVVVKKRRVQRTNLAYSKPLLRLQKILQTGFSSSHKNSELRHWWWEVPLDCILLQSFWTLRLKWQWYYHVIIDEFLQAVGIDPMTKLHRENKYI